MTAADLHKLVQGIEECVPEPVCYNRDLIGCWSYDTAYISPLHASDLIAGHVRRMLYASKSDAVQWLYIEVGCFLDGKEPKPFTCIRESSDIDTPEQNVAAPTELEALLAAYRAWKGKETA